MTHNGRVVSWVALIALTVTVAGQTPAKKPPATPTRKPQVLAADQLYKRTLPSIMTLTVECADATYSGTAFLAIKQGVAVTAWHVVKGAKKVVAKFSSGETFDVSGLIDKDEVRDIALIRIKVADRPLLKLAQGDPAIGSRAYVIGAPEGMEYTLSDGLIGQVQTIDGIRQYQFTCPISHGNSGGPLMDVYGQVLGVVDWQYAEGQNLNFAVPVTYVRGLDDTLPTTPWSEVKIEIPDKEPAAPAPKEGSAGEAKDPPANDLPKNTPAELRGVLEAALMSIMEAYAAICHSTSEVLLANDGGKGGPTPQLFESRESLKKVAAQLEPMRAEAPFFPKVQSQLLAEIGDMQSAIETQLEAIATKQKLGGFNPVSNNKSSQVVSKVTQAFARATRDELGALMADKTFFDSLPAGLRYVLRPDADESGYTLGTVSWPEKPNQFACVWANGFAYALGFRTNDEVLALDNLPVNDGVDLKYIILGRAGKKVKARIRRLMKVTEIEVKVPKEIPLAFRQG